MGNDDSRESYRAPLYERYRSAHVVPGGSAFASTRSPYISRLVRRHFPSERDVRIVEVGCGGGDLLAALHCAGYRDLIGVDVSPEQVAAAAARGIGRVERADAQEYLSRLEPGSIDVLVAFDLLEHLTKPEITKLLTIGLRALRSDGRLIIHSVNAESPFFGAVRYGDLTHETAFTRRSMRQLCLSLGYRNVECYEDSPVVHGPISMCRAVLWRMVRTALRMAVAIETGESGRGGIFSQNFITVATK